jgi:hypothetical protein
MRLDDGDRPLNEVRVHLTAKEAEAVIAAVRDALDDIARIGLPSSHNYVAIGQQELGLFVYPDAASLEADAADSLG